jgi:hypothetical protein
MRSGFQRAQSGRRCHRSNLIRRSQNDDWARQNSATIASSCERGFMPSARTPRHHTFTVGENLAPKTPLGLAQAISPQDDAPFWQPLIVLLRKGEPRLEFSPCARQCLPCSAHAISVPQRNESFSNLPAFVVGARGWPKRAAGRRHLCSTPWAYMTRTTSRSNAARGELCDPATSKTCPFRMSRLFVADCKTRLHECLTGEVTAYGLTRTCKVATERLAPGKARSGNSSCACSCSEYVPATSGVSVGTRPST